MEVKNVVEYKIIRAANWQNLEKKVNKYIQQGWKPQGSSLNTGIHWTQAVIREA